ncbi:LITAF-like zinc ribbon domain-containing protein [Hirsutella rhossiliensis]|uniref:LITAF-like zinc ribbon domain-containing protein n=1 Tax=Hirsutella rhossiliensis TaxID=111463 RepID=A0A9P8SLS5_9HYPO|nr:LITAF-like zinc ribbon domain-containing protein [Hirsutella rhossiliensis]KAH0967818.1 LITAF-like zinc ribbon domain-containing protein [Hirsutella rhossiliensis]
MATTIQDASIGPAPAKEMPANLFQTEQTGQIGSGQAMPTINPLPNPQTVTPLHLLNGAPQWIDCPFCQRRTQTSVEKMGTGMQTLAAVLCCIFCICLTCVPCLAAARRPNADFWAAV